MLSPKPCLAAAKRRPSASRSTTGGAPPPGNAVFGKQAESILRYGKKGKKVAITGRLVSNKYTRRTDNVEVTVYEIIANQVEFLSPRDSEDASDSGYMPDEPAADSVLGDKNNAKQDDYSDVLEGDLPF